MPDYPHRYKLFPSRLRLIGRYCVCRDCLQAGTVADYESPSLCPARTLARIAVLETALLRVLDGGDHEDARRVLEADDA